MASRKLYELTEAYENIQNLMDDETVDISILETALQEIQGEIEVKCSNACILLKGLEAEAEMFKAEEKRLSDRRRTLEAKRDWLKSYMQGEIEKIGLDKIKAGVFTVSLQANPPALKIIDKDIIPAKYITIIPASEAVNNAAVKDALKAGEIVPGAELTQGKSVRIR